MIDGSAGCRPDAVAESLKRWLPEGLAYRLIRAKNVLVGIYLFHLLRKYPHQAKSRLVKMVKEELGSDFDVAKHFTPSYKPWDQRLCLVPDGDLFKTLREGRASVVTDHIDRFTPEGISLRSGEVLPADVIVTATGLQLNLLGDVRLSLGGVPVDTSDMLVYKGMMFSGLPNVVNTFGYTNASWTLKADLTARYFCRLLRHMDRHEKTVFTPTRDNKTQPEPFLDFTSGYVQRAAAWLPKQGLPQPAAIGIFGSGAARFATGDSSYIAGYVDGAFPPPPPAGSTKPPSGLMKTMMSYFEGVEANDPMVSPAGHLDVLAKFPPTLVITGTRASDMSPAIYTHNQLLKADVASELIVGEGLGHCYIYSANVPEAQDAYAAISKFFQKHLK